MTKAAKRVTRAVRDKKAVKAAAMTTVRSTTTRMVTLRGTQAAPLRAPAMATWAAKVTLPVQAVRVRAAEVSRLGHPKASPMWN